MSYQTQKVQIKDRVEVTFVVNQYGAVSFQPPGAERPSVKYGTIIGIDDFGLNLKIRLDNSPNKLPFHIPLAAITSIDQNTAADTETWGESVGFFVRTGEPVDTIGKNGNVWFDIISPNRVYYKENNHWVYKCSLKGEIGHQGVPGRTSQLAFVDNIGLQISYVYTNIDEMIRDYHEAQMRYAVGVFKDPGMKHKFGDIVCYIDQDTLQYELFLSTPLNELPKIADHISHETLSPHVHIIEECGLMYFGALNETPGLIRGLAGKDGLIPYIHPESDHWFVGGNDTGVCAVGRQGPQGIPGTSGRDGKDGVDGKPGPQGIPGKNGDSMYYNPVDDKFYIGSTDVTKPMEDLVERVLRRIQST